MESGVSSRPVDDLDLWLEVSGGKKKGRTIGAGNVSDPSYVVTGESSSNRSQAVVPSVEEVNDLRSQLQDYQARLTNEQAMRIAIQESMASMEERHARFKEEARRREEEARKQEEERKEELREHDRKAEADRAEIWRMMQELMKSQDHPPPQ